LNAASESFLPAAFHGPPVYFHFCWSKSADVPYSVVRAPAPHAMKHETVTIQTDVRAFVMY